MTSKRGQRIPAEVGGTLSPAAAAMYELAEVIQKNAPPMLRHSGMVPVGDANARRPAPNPAGCPAWARPRQPRYWAWNAAGLVGNDLAIDGRADVPLRHLTSTSPYMAAAAGLSVPPTSAGIRWPRLDVIQRARWQEPVLTADPLTTAARPCVQLSRMIAATSWTAARKFRASLS